MSIGQISLTASARANLMALQNSAKLLSTTQAHLSSGKKVNSALDNASSFFASQGFLNSANDLSNLKDSMSTALQTIKAASDAITSITNVVTQLQGVANSAAQTQDTATRAGYAAQYNGLLTQLDNLANDATFNGTNLVNSVVSSLKVVFNASATTNLVIGGSNLTGNGLGTDAAIGGFAVGALASQNAYSLTVGNTTANPQAGAYSGTFSNLAVTAATAATVAGAAGAQGDKIVSGGVSAYAGAGNTAVLVTDSAVISGAANGATGSTGGALFTSITDGTHLTQAGFTASATTTAAGGGAGAGKDSLAVTGAFTATAGSAATFAAAPAGQTNVLTSGAAGATGIMIQVAAGAAIKVVHDSGATGGGQATALTTTTYTNTTNNTLSFYLDDGAGTAIVAQNGATGTSAAYNLSAVAFAASAFTGRSLANGQTFNGADLVSSGGVTVGNTVTAQTTTAAAAGTALGTGASGGVSAYDASAATINTIATIGVLATQNAGNTAVYSSKAGASITMSAGLVSMTGTKTGVVADALTTAQNQLSSALTTLRTAGSSLGNNNTLVQTRQDFTTNFVNDLQTASDNLILADTNEEGANMQALQAQNQLGIISLGISGQLAQSILKLF